MQFTTYSEKETIQSTPKYAIASYSEQFSMYLIATDNVIISKTQQTSTNLRSSALICLHQR